VTVPQRPTFSIIIPTAGRPTLAATLASVTPQLEAGDEILVIRSDDADWGARARNSAVDRARGTHLLFMDDDDEYAPEALRAMRDFAADHPERIGIFRMRWEFWHLGTYGRVLWDTPELRVNNVSTQMFLVPNLPGKVASWDSQYGHDYRFILDTVALQGDPLFRDTLVARIRPDRRGFFARLATVYIPVAAKQVRRRLLGLRVENPGRREQLPGIDDAHGSARNDG